MKRMFELTEKELRNIISQEIQKNQNVLTDDKGYLTRDQACEKLHISLPTLHKYFNTGFLSKIKIGSKTYVDPKQIDELFKNGRI